MSVETLFTLLVVIGALIVLLQLLVVIVWWRQGSKYGRLEKARRELIARDELSTVSKLSPLPSKAKFTDWDVQPDFDDPPHGSSENPQVK